MAAFPGSRSDAPTAILKRVYLPRLRNQINTDTILMDRLKRVPEHMFTGEDLAITLRTERGVTQTVGDAGVADTLPPRSTQAYARALFDVKMIAHRIGWSWTGLRRAAKAGEGAIIDIFRAEMEGSRDGMGDEINQQWMGDSTGRKTTMLSVRLTASTIFHVARTDFLRVGMPVFIGHQSAGKNVTAVTAGAANTVSSIDSGTQITLAITASSLSILESLYQRRGTTAASALVNTDMFGLAGIASTDNPAGGSAGLITSLLFGKIDRRGTGNRYWQGLVDNGDGSSKRPLTAALLKQGLNRIERAGGKKRNKDIMGFMTDAGGLEYGASLAADKRYPAAFVTLDGGFDALEFAGKPMVWDPDMPAETFFWITMSDLMIAEMEEIDFIDDDGSTLFRVAGKGQFEAVLATWTQLIAQRNNSHIQMKLIRESSPTHNK